MKNRCGVACSLAVIMALASGAGAAEPLQSIQLIDDFRSGPFHQVMPAMPADWGTFYQPTPDVLGGVRLTSLIADDTLGSSSRIDIESSRLMVSSGIGSYFGAILGYGYDAAGNDADMHANFEGYDYFQIDFERSDLGLIYLVEVWDGQGTIALRADTLTTEAQSAPFSAKLPLADFLGDDAEGNPQAIDWQDIRYLVVLFQSANASGGNDFSVTSITAVDEVADGDE
jgi:hypothetical protein